MTEMLQHPFASTPFAPKQAPSAESFWTTAPRDGFAARCAAHRFREEVSERQRRKAAGVAAEVEMTA